MEWYMIAAVIGVGILVGFINTLAGSGSVISLPLLIFLGLPANVANGTNRVALIMQNIVGVSSFYRKGKLDTGHGWVPSIAAVIGALVGANIAADLNEEVMEKAIGVLMVIMFFVILYKPNRWITEKREVKSQNVWLQMVVFFLVGVYGGFIQAGVGIFLLAALVLNAGYDLVRANALKLLIVLIYTPFALAVFVLNDQVWWIYGLILGVGTMIGSFLATRFALKWGPKYIRYILLFMIVVSAFKLFGMFEWIGL
ncbi:MAG: sulfite exporter TauE/SafE family protein [Bacteroidales bacterium]|nr:sulfite exporter TauE/SafE family protein [Bacteroidales bacterium]MCF8333591.1 sulfite exporter TauE/SafE family protein [Bacteroidales bacterium]